MENINIEKKALEKNNSIDLANLKNLNIQL